MQKASMLVAIGLGLVSANMLAAPAEPRGCAQLCGNWVLEATGGESAEQVVDAAIAQYRLPRQNGPRFSRSGEMPASGREPAGDAARGDTGPDPAPPAAGGGFEGPRPMHPSRETMRDELVAALKPPASLAFSDKGNEILLRPAAGPERRIFPGEPHSRVDSRGTARIRSDWKKGALAFSEDFGGGRRNAETYSLQPDGTLQLALVVERSGMKELRLRAVYRRAEAGR
jgi:hypothetical protein